MNSQSEKHPVRSGADDVPGRQPRRVSSVDLLQGYRRLLIEHEGVDYQLQLTRQGKLILTK